MAVDRETRRTIQTRYIQGTMTLRQLALATNMRYGSIAAWSRKYGWKNKRAEFRANGGQPVDEEETDLPKLPPSDTAEALSQVREVRARIYARLMRQLG